MRLAEEARRQGMAHLDYLGELLKTECHERETRGAARRIKEAGFPLVKTLEGFDFRRASHLPEVLLRELATGHYIDQAEPILFLGEPGTGKTHLAPALGVAAATQGRSVRFVTVARLVTDLTEAHDAHQLGRVMGRYNRVEVVVLDELGYVPLGRTDAELLFQVRSRAAGTSARACDHQPPLWRMDFCVLRCALMPGRGGPTDASGAHHRDRDPIHPIGGDLSPYQARW